MVYRILYTESYNKIASAFIKKHPDIINQYIKTLQLLELNPFHPSLRMHKLSGKYKNLHSASINMQYRITIELVVTDNEIIPISIGSHDEVYK